MRRKHGLCQECKSGWVPGTPKTYSPNCRGCVEKKAAGLRTGDEPPPLLYGRKRYDNEARLRAEAAGRKRARVLRPSF
jgi:hypothetical protein